MPFTYYTGTYGAPGAISLAPPTSKTEGQRVFVDDQLSKDRNTGAETNAPADAPSVPTLDYSTFLGLFGLPSDVQTKINAIVAQAPDVNTGVTLALAYVRGTPWYAQTYPGIQEGFAKGIVSNEAEYRSLLNQQTGLYRQYLGRDIGSAEFAAHLAEGVTTDTVGRRLSGAAYVKANGNDIQYLQGAFGEGRLSDPELKAYGEEQAGIDTPLGQQLQRRLQLAQERMRNVFGGNLATAGLGVRNGQLASTTLGASDAPDIGR